MALDKQIIPVSFGQGVDTKTDPKQVQAGKLLRLENALFTKAKRIQKRNGYSSYNRSIAGGGTLTAPSIVASRGDELLAAQNGRLYGFNEQDSVWVEKGYYESVLTDKTELQGSSLQQHGCTSASNNKYTLRVFTETSTASTVPTVKFIVTDKATGEVVIPKTTDNAGYYSGGSALYPAAKAVKIGSSQLAFISVDSLTNHLVCVRVSISGGVATLAKTTIATDNSLTAPLVTTTIDGASYSTEVFDVDSTNQGAVVSYLTASNTVKTITINTSGVVVDTATGVGTNIATIHCKVQTNNRIFVYWFETGKIQYVVYSSSLSVLLATTQIATGFIGAVPKQLSAIQDQTNANKQFLVASYYTASGEGYGIVTVYNIPDTGSPTKLGNMTGSGNYMLAGHVFYQDGGYYVPVAHLDLLEGQVLLYRFWPATWTNGGLLASGIYVEASVVARALYGIQCFAFTVPALLDKMTLVGSKATYPFSYSVGLITVGSTNYNLYNLCVIGFDFDSVDKYQSFEVQNTLIFSGGRQYIYDGSVVKAQQYYAAPKITSAVGANAPLTGHMSDGTYVYYLVPVYTDNLGNLYRGTPSLPYSITLTGGTATQKVTVNFYVLNAQTTENVKYGAAGFELYRTENSGTLAHLVQAVSGSFYEDTASDATISGGAALYTTGGVVENTAQPSFRSAVVHNNRVWLVDSEDKNTLYYSKQLQTGVGVQFSDILTVAVDKVKGETVAVSKLDDKLVVMCENAPAVYSGDGANDLGISSTLSPAQFIPSDSGALSARSVASFPFGVMYKGSKGFYLLDRSLTTKYIGMEVEDYNSQNIVNATMDYTRSHIRFLTSSGLTLVYDYLFQQWSTFTNHEGLSACLLNGSYVYLRTDGAIYKEEPSYYLDDTLGFSVLVQTAWIALAGIQGFQRLRRIALLGDYATGANDTHALSVEMAYDFDNTTWSTPITHVFGADNSSGKFQYRQRFVRQKCDAVSIRITEVVTDDADEYVDLADCSFEAGVKRGINKLAAGDSE